MPKRAATVAAATPCWPAPVSAMTRFLPSRWARSAKFGVVAIARVLGLELVERANQRFSDENAAVLTEVAALVRQVIHAR